MRGDGEPGPRRKANMLTVKKYLRKEGASTYQGIATGTGLTINQTTMAIYDLQKHDPDVLAVPAHGNSWRTSLGWTLEARTGEVSQLRHNATRVRNQAHRLSKDAVARTNIYEKAMLEAEARTMVTVADNLDHLADTMEHA